MQPDNVYACQQAISRLRKQLLSFAQNFEGQAKEIVACMQELQVIDDLVRADVPAAAPAQAGRHRGKKKEYAVVNGPSGPSLEEKREGGTQPFLCPKDVYDAVAAVLDRESEPIGFADLKHEIETDMERTVPDYLPRMCVRFWKDRDIIEKVRTSYQAKGKSFKRAAKKAWEAARDPSA